MKRIKHTHHLNYGNKCLQKFYYKNNGRNEIFEKKIHGKEVSHDRAIPLSEAGGWGRPLHFLHRPSPVLFFQHLDANFKGKISLTSGQKWPNFGAK